MNNKTLNCACAPMVREMQQRAAADHELSTVVDCDVCKQSYEVRYNPTTEVVEVQAFTTGNVRPSLLAKARDMFDKDE